jgi:hypothetical protein
MLRHLLTHALLHLTFLFNSILQFGYFPSIWQAAKVIPIPKPNKPPTNATSYRPISLLSIVSKLFERIIASRLNSIRDSKSSIPEAQFGFRKQHSTVAQLARITDYNKSRTDSTYENIQEWLS